MGKVKEEKGMLSSALNEACALLVLHTDLYSSVASARQSIIARVKKRKLTK